MSGQHRPKIKTSRINSQLQDFCRPEIVFFIFQDFARHVGTLSTEHTDRSPYLITKRRVPELIPVLSSQPAGDTSHKPGGRLPLLSARPAVTPTTFKRAATNFAAW